MNSIVFSMAAASCASVSSLFFRKNNSNARGYGAGGYLVIYYLLSLIFSIIFDRSILETPVSYYIILFGICTGGLNVALMYLTFKALKEGSAGYTYAFQNASAAFPGLFLFLIFGKQFGFALSLWQLFGIILVILGLFWGAVAGEERSAGSNRWLFYALSCFAVQSICLTLIQARCLLFQCEAVNLPISESQDSWFIPAFFASASLLQLLFFLREGRGIYRHEVSFGVLGGLANLFSMVLLAAATKWALPYEKGILFPVFSVTTILLCNAWAYKLYGERFNISANLLCGIGIFLGMIG